MKKSDAKDDLVIVQKKGNPPGFTIPKQPEEKFRICVEKVIDGHPKIKNLQNKNGKIWFNSIADAVGCLDAKNAHYLKHSQWMFDIHGYHVWTVFNKDDEIVCAN